MFRILDIILEKSGHFWQRPVICSIWRFLSWILLKMRQNSMAIDFKGMNNLWLCTELRKSDIYILRLGSSTFFSLRNSDNWIRNYQQEARLMVLILTEGSEASWQVIPGWTIRLSGQSGNLNDVSYCNKIQYRFAFWFYWLPLEIF